MHHLIIRFALCSLVIGVVSTVSSTAQRTVHQQVVVSNDDARSIRALPSFDPHAIWTDHDGTHAIIAISDAARLSSSGIDVRIEIDDVARRYADRAAGELKSISDGSLNLLSVSDPNGFRFGSVGGHLSLDEIYQECARMRAAYPLLVSDTIRIGESVEGRAIHAIRIASPDVEASAPEALWIALIHAREPIGMMSAFYSAWDLLERYGSDPESTSLLDERILWIIPVANPDGYRLNIVTDPNGGGLWRKNRGAGGEGVDLNRNFGSFEDWSQPVDGGSDDVASSTYRGSAPFSEPESRAIRDFILARHISSVVSHHSFSNVLIIPPYGEESGIDAFDGWLFNATSALNRETGFGPGTSSIAVGYPVSGSYELWASKLVNDDRSEVYSWVPETGSDEEGFWPPPSRILELSRRLNAMNRRSLQMAGAHPVVRDMRFVEGDGEVVARFDLMNVGTRDMIDSGTLSIAGDVTATARFGPIEPGASMSIDVPIAGEIDSARVRAQITITADRTTSFDEWRSIRHDHDILFRDDFTTTLEQWEAGAWGIETTTNLGRVAADSPYEQYTFSNQPSIFSMKDAVSTVGYDAVELVFSAIAEIYAREHRVVIEARGDGGEWRRVDGRYLQSGRSGVDTLRSELRGDIGVIREYVVPLDELAGRNIEVRFVMQTPFLPLFETYDGILLSEVSIRAAKRRITAVDEPIERKRISLLPNPAERLVRVDGVDRFSYEIVDRLGRSTGLRGVDITRSIDVGALPSGVYYITIIADDTIHRLPLYRR